MLPPQISDFSLPSRAWQGAPIPESVQRYLDLGDVLNQNRLPTAAGTAIRAARLELISSFPIQDLEILMAIGQDRQQRIVEDAARKRVEIPVRKAA
jgi:CobQ-like glutamine amidotransferase family enzyme